MVRPTLFLHPLFSILSKAQNLEENFYRNHRHIYCIYRINEAVAVLEVAAKKLAIKGYRPSEKGRDPEGDLRYIQMSVDPNVEYVDPSKLPWGARDVDVDPELDILINQRLSKL